MSQADYWWRVDVWSDHREIWMERYCMAQGRTRQEARAALKRERPALKKRMLRLYRGKKVTPAIAGFTITFEGQIEEPT